MSINTIGKGLTEDKNMSNEKSQGLWDEPIPEEIASALSVGEEVTPVKEEFNPAFGQTSLHRPRRETPVTKRSVKNNDIKSAVTDDAEVPDVSDMYSPPAPRDNKPQSVKTHQQAYCPQQHAIDPQGSESTTVSTHTSSDINQSNSNQSKLDGKKKTLFGNVDKFTKPKLIRASVKTVIPHIILVFVCGLIAWFPSVVVSLIGDEINQFPQNIVDVFPTGVTVFFAGLALMIILTMFRSLATGSLWLYEDYLKFRIGVIGSEMHYYGNLQKVGVQKTLSSLWSDTGDLIILHPKGSMTLRNIYAPFEVQERLNKKINDYKNM